MTRPAFITAAGVRVPVITAEQMREVDRITMEDFHLGILQMMENAGRNLAEVARDMLGRASGTVTVLAGAGGNGGGGLCAARHLRNHGFAVRLVLDREATALTGAAQIQYEILRNAGLAPVRPEELDEALRSADLVIDALIGYSLRGAPRGRASELIALCNQHSRRVLSLDVPSGLNATTGEAPGAIVSSERTLTLALPKTGLWGVPGDLYLADIGIPPEVYGRLGIEYVSPFAGRYWLPIHAARKHAMEGS